MSIMNYSTFSDTAAFLALAKSAIIGHHHYPHSQYERRVIVVAPTESSAQMFIENAGRSQYALAYGLDTDPGSIPTKTFSGHVIFTPDVEHLKDASFIRFADLLNTLIYSFRHSSNWRRDFQVLFPSRSVENQVVCALFEEWKNVKECKLNWHFDGEEARYCRGPNSMRGDWDSHPELGRKGEQPYYLNPQLMHAQLIKQNAYVAEDDHHDVRFGAGFNAFSPSALSYLIDKVNRCGSELSVNLRKVYLGDEMAYRLFVYETFQSPPQSYAGQACSGDACEPSARILLKNLV
ncbi:hypothetical protein LU11_gp028 [Pseudomonas phage Lu11]|uniref:hypothetical protein n=1 Tax=Pseudomonas phage Lu11 TaxID=1161927 RepID=UPI00025F14F6|nr:hypothetical protein LU11_gp028 [Pseudomonas phage Lu11]AFH14559.1 hypothetical protein Lu11_0028 [Pseudomonas phage Lu11]